MKRKARFLAGLLIVLALTNIGMPAFAASGGNGGSENVMPLSIEYIDLKLSNDGIFHTKAQAQLRKGDTVTIMGTWNPIYTEIWVMIELTDESRAVSRLLESGSTVTLTVPVNGNYNFRVMVPQAESPIESGMLSVEW